MDGRSTNIAKTQQPSQNPGSQESNIKQVPYWRPTNIRT